MSFLGIAGGPASDATRFLQDVDATIASNVAHDAALRGRVNRLRGMGDLGATPARGTRAWWVWYTTVYLPQTYSQSQIQQYIQSSPYYYQFGSPYSSIYAPYNPQYGYGYGQNPYSYPYSNYYNQQYQTGYPYNYGYSYNYGYGYDPYGQAQYTQYQSQQGAYACQQQGGYWDYAQQTCNGGSRSVIGPTGSPPNVVGMPFSQAVSALNAAGFNVWELNRDGVSQGVPPGYAANRVDISTANGVVTAAAVG